MTFSSKPQEDRQHLHVRIVVVDDLAHEIVEPHIGGHVLAEQVKGVDRDLAIGLESGGVTAMELVLGLAHCRRQGVVALAGDPQLGDLTDLLGVALSASARASITYVPAGLFSGHSTSGGNHFTGGTVAG